MAGRPKIGSRLVILVAVASTLLATWLPTGQACACGTPATASDRSKTESAPAATSPCPCCRHRSADDHARHSCCPSDQPAAAVRAGSTCDCTSPARPDDSQPAAPPRPADSDEAGGPLVADGPATAGVTRPPVTTPAVEAALGRAGPPPVDLVISLLRITC